MHSLKYKADFNDWFLLQLAPAMGFMWEENSATANKEHAQEISPVAFSNPLYTQIGVCTPGFSVK